MFLAGLFVYTMFATCLFQTALGGDKKGDNGGLLGMLLANAMNKHKERKERKQKEEEEAEQKAKDEKEARRLLRLKAFSELKKEVDAHANDDSDEAKQLREQYESTLTCMYDENGKERSEEEIQEQYKKLPKSMRESVDKYSKMDPNSDEVKKQVEKFNNTPFSESDVAIAQEEIKSDIAKIQKRHALEELDEQKEKELKSAKSEEEKAEIEKKYKEKREKTEKFYDIKINKAEENIENIKEESSDDGSSDDGSSDDGSSDDGSSDDGSSDDGSSDDEETVKDKDGVEWIRRKKERGDGFTYCRKDDRSITMSQEEYQRKQSSKDESIDNKSLQYFLTEHLGITSLTKFMINLIDD